MRNCRAVRRSHCEQSIGGCCEGEGRRRMR
jgi:hypothetical protein